MEAENKNEKRTKESFATGGGKIARLITMFLILIALQACLLIYVAPGEAENTNLWTFVTNIDNWNSLTFILTLVAIAAGIGLVGVAAGSVFGFRTDFLLLAPAIGGIISMGVVFVNLGNVIRNELFSNIFSVSAGGDCAIDAIATCTPVTYLVAIIIGPMALYYVWTVIEWWRGKDY